jgi:hypothetical protein
VAHPRFEFLIAHVRGIGAQPGIGAESRHRGFVVPSVLLVDRIQSDAMHAHGREGSELAHWTF